MLEDKFKFTRANIILIVINAVLVIFVIFAAIQLITSLKDSSGEIPELKTTAGKSSTLSADATSTTTTESTTTTTTKKKGNDSSPYYDFDIYTILNKELLEKETLIKDEKIELGKEYFQVISALVDPSDDTLFNIEHLLSHVKDGEQDKIVYKDHTYGMIYGGKKFLNTYFTAEGISRLINTKFNEIRSVYCVDETGNCYKIGSEGATKTYTVHQYQFVNVSSNEFRIDIVYTDDRVKNSEYKSGNVYLRYIKDEKKWKVYGFAYPNKDV